MRNKEIFNNLKPSRLLILSGKMHQITYSVGHQSPTVVGVGEETRGSGSLFRLPPDLICDLVTNEKVFG